jgi:homoserine kinase type II
MAVFTPVSLADLRSWISQFPLGQAHAIRGISSGIENSNFFIDTDRGEYVLTIFENLSFDQLPFYLHLMDHLAKHAIPVPAPVANQEGKLISALHGKPAAIVSKLAGASELQPTPLHCAEVGTMLARMHLAGQSFEMHQPNLRGLPWWNEITPKVLPYLDPEQQQLLTSELSYQQACAAAPHYAQLPLGPIHADLFRNNVMFSQGKLSGFFDFYFAGCDTWIFDLAVTCNDWCIDLSTGEPDPERTGALLVAYQTIRPLTQSESEAWNSMLRAAALRFWLSRLFDFHQPRAAEVLIPHDPAHFERILRKRRAV